MPGSRREYLGPVEMTPNSVSSYQRDFIIGPALANASACAKPN
jgi:hypothetical protein